jgi:hypothetical protein
MPEWWQLEQQIGSAKIFHCLHHEGMKDTNGFARGAMLKCGMALQCPVKICM